MRRLIREAKRPFVAIMITDGCVQEDIFQDIVEQFSGSKSFILIQIGTNAQLASKLKRRGFPTYVLDDAADLKGIVLNHIADKYI